MLSDNMPVFLRVMSNYRYFSFNILVFFSAFSCMLSRLSTAFNIPGFITPLCSPKWPNQTHSLLLFALVRVASEVEQRCSRGDVVKGATLMTPDPSLCWWYQSASVLGAKKWNRLLIVALAWFNNDWWTGTNLLRAPALVWLWFTSSTLQWDRAADLTGQPRHFSFGMGTRWVTHWVESGVPDIFVSWLRP